VDLIAERFGAWGGSVISLGADARTAARAYHFFTALRQADIVHAHAHGGAKQCQSDVGPQTFPGLCFHDRLFTVTDLDPIWSQIRCRLLVLSACRAGQLTAGPQSFVYPLVRHGVKVVAASEDINAIAAIVFFDAFYKSLFPRIMASGTLANAMRDGGKACYAEGGNLLRGEWGTIASMTIYGHPKTVLHFRLRRSWLRRLLRVPGDAAD
jgi:CHAT domain-containing protein